MEKKIMISSTFMIAVIALILVSALLQGKGKLIVENGNYSPSDQLMETDDAYPFYTISELNGLNRSGTYSTQGYLVYLSYCPPCPEDADCAICESPNLVISQRNNFTERTYYKEIKIGKTLFRDHLPSCKETELVVDFSVPGLDPDIHHKFRWSSLDEWAYPFELDRMYRFTLEMIKPQEIGYNPTIDSCPRPKMLGKIIGIEQVE